MSAPAPSISGAITFRLYDPSAVLAGCSSRSGSYCVIAVDPGSSGFMGYDQTFSVTLSVGVSPLVTAQITLTTEVVIPAPKIAKVNSGTTYTYAQVVYALPQVTSTMVVESPVGVTLATITDRSNFGQLESAASYTPPS